MQIETINVIEIYDNKVMQVIAFSGRSGKDEARNVFQRLVLEHNDPENIPPQNPLGFT
jgi:hypothetical protein